MEIVVADVDEFWYGESHVRSLIVNESQISDCKAGCSGCTELEEILNLPSSVSLESLDNTLRMVISLFSISHGKPATQSRLLDIFLPYPYTPPILGLKLPSNPDSDKCSCLNMCRQVHDITGRVSTRLSSRTPE
jgi:hypothetical protein